MIDRIPNSHYSSYVPGSPENTERGGSVSLELRTSLLAFTLQLEELFNSDTSPFPSKNLVQVAQTIVNMDTFSKRAEKLDKYKTVGSDVQQILRTLPSIGSSTSLLEAASLHLKDPSSPAFPSLLEEYHRNRLAVENLLVELTAIADELV